MAKMICDRCEETFYVRRSELDCSTVYCKCEKLVKRIKERWGLVDYAVKMGNLKAELEPWECRRIL